MSHVSEGVLFIMLFSRFVTCRFSAGCQWHGRYGCKDYESRRMLNEDTAFYRQMEPEIADKYIRYPSYREFLDYYLWFFNQHIPTIRKSQGGSKDWRQTFDELSAKPFQPKSKQALLERCIKEIGENFSAQDVNSYLDKYIHITQDTLLPDRIRDQYVLCRKVLADFFDAAFKQGLLGFWLERFRR